MTTRYTLSPFTPLNLMLLASGLGLGIAASCVKPNEDHCRHSGGDAACAELYGNERPYCVGGESCDGVSEFNGCVTEVPNDDCYYPCGDHSAASGACDEIGDESSEGTEEDDTTETETTEGTDTTDGPECDQDEDCADEAAPFCNSDGQCVPCSGADDPDGVCEAATPATPLCDTDLGLCVECTSDDTSLCEEGEDFCSDGSCSGCWSHTQCAGGAGCDLLAGLCLPQDAVLHVDHTGIGDYETATEALLALNGGSGTLIVHDQGGIGVYSGALDVASGQVLVLIALDNDLPLIDGGDAPALTVADEGAVYIEQVRISGEAGVTIASGGVGYVDRTQVTGTAGHAVVTSGDLELRNSMLVSEANGFAPVLVLQGGQLQASYDTIIAAEGDAIVSCVPPIGPGSAVFNSVLGRLQPMDEPDYCDGQLYFAGNAVADEANVSGGANTSVGAFQSAWFEDVVDGDLHLTSMAPTAIGEAAEWMEGQPTADIDGEPRVLGAPGCAGADVPTE